MTALAEPPAPTREAEIDTLARTLWGEARNDGEPAMTAIAAVVLNRVRISAELGGRHWWGSDIVGVCRARSQFPCWSPGAPGRAKLMAVDETDLSFRLARAVAERAVNGLIQDPTYGATSYKAADLSWPPAWGRMRLPLVMIGRLEFYDFLVE